MTGHENSNHSFFAIDQAVSAAAAAAAVDNVSLLPPLRDKFTFLHRRIIRHTNAANSSFRIKFLLDDLHVMTKTLSNRNWSEEHSHFSKKS